ncbi:MAG: hypothetical protein AB8G26_01735, partial [Ilumatobacter sp.]
MQRRSFIGLLAAAPAVLTACGSDGTTLPQAETPAESSPETTPVADDDTDGSTTDPVADADLDGDTVVLSLTAEGGFTTREFAFQNPPTLLVTDDGRA